MRIATWNINSVRMRLDLLFRLMEEEAPDVICLQETKVVDPDFPLQPLVERGYVHTHIHGMKSYNGVAILSRLPFSSHDVQHWCGKQDCRHALASLPGGVELHCVYIPAGGDIPDPAVNDKFAHKLQFLDEMTHWFGSERSADRPMVLVGDLNIAPLEQDVWSHKELLSVVSHTPVEVEKLAAMQGSAGWVDAMRHFVPANEKLYTWWSYRAKDWAASNRGRRLDHVWVTPPLAGSLKGVKVLRDARGWEPKPSDHVPVIVDLDV
ncbi:exodeoxyribonuclease III [Azospirillum sp. TSO35-2]|uniref:exodeoxyribonuclease III n=1 Tax=Azospirillum sp. TSO35-2 TaxID=716796 RepID=UPI000D6200B1|nr:exodeoxyribonuclease III [Azospirillum sp. TSO35-2]PWC36207.1 exodeoxyribonuclease III [Azospirillum sp. TSO35-2]